MNYIKCNGTCVKDCFDCNKYYSFHSSHYDSFYNRRIIEISCCIGGNRIYEDNDDNTGRRLV